MASRRSSTSTTDGYPAALLMPLQLIDPSPLHSPAVSEHSDALKDGYIPRNVPYWLSQTHRYSSYVFSGFLAIHVTTVALIPLATSLDQADKSILLTRVLYQNPIIEPTLVFGSLGVHILSGFALRLYRKRQWRTRYGVAVRWLGDVSPISLTGYILVPLVGSHTAMTRFAPLKVLGGSEDIGLGFLSHGFRRYPWVNWILYAGLTTVGSFHFVQGWAKWLQLPKRWKNAVTASTIGLAVVWFTGSVRIGLGGLATGLQGRTYDKVYKTFFTRLPLI